ncbi:MAG TPA: Fic/DOC family N-terminal domain-containing protein [Bacteroidota bacterium]|nr:Fic/DOC family N-terminal domain-containing protein [Bacteroidota bacterium]
MRPYIPQNLPISEIDWERHIPFIGKVNRSLAYYDGILHGIANPALLLSPLTTQEAVLSSKIEGTQATLGDVLKFEAGESPTKEERRIDIQEITNYRRALFTAEKMLKTKPFHLNFMKELHAIILDSVRGSNKSPGEFRKTQNWIGKPGTSVEHAEYVPPSPEVMMKCLSDWEKYYHFDRPDPVVQLAILHAQFELVHPFLDGNGRVGRMIIPLFLFEKKILSRPMFYLSKYLEAHRDEYVSRLKTLSERPPQWNEWIGFFLRGVDEQARENADTVQKILALYDNLKEQCIRLTRSQFAVPLLDQIFKKPIFQSSHLFGKKNLPSKPMTSTLLAKLREAGILKVLSEGSGRRAQVMVLPELINITEGKKIF